MIRDEISKKEIEEQKKTRAMIAQLKKESKVSVEENMRLLASVKQQFLQRFQRSLPIDSMIDTLKIKEFEG